jgi:hypothetical protein
MLTSSNDPNDRRALKYPVVKKILRQTAHQRYSLSTNLK